MFTHNMKQNTLDNSKLALFDVWKTCKNNSRNIYQKKKKKKKKGKTHKKQNNVRSSL